MLLNQFGALNHFGVEGEPDTTAPVINLTPDQTSFTISVGDSFTPPTAIATDNIDDDAVVTAVDVDSFDTTAAGIYTFTYDHTDSAGIEADTVTITVEVLNAIATFQSIAESTFEIDTDKTLVAYSNRSNRSISRFKPLDLINGVQTTMAGHFDFDENNVSKVEVYANGSVIDSTTSAVTWSAGDLSVELGALGLTNGLVAIEIIVYVGTDTKGIVFCGPGLDANIFVTFRVLNS